MHMSPGEFDDDIEATTFTRGKIEGLIAHEKYEIETRGGMCLRMCLYVCLLHHQMLH